MSHGYYPIEAVASGRELVAALEDVASPVGTGSQSSAAQIAGGDANIGDVLGSHIAKLRHARAVLVADRKRLMKELSNADIVHAD